MGASAAMVGFTACALRFRCGGCDIGGEVVRSCLACDSAGITRKAVEPSGLDVNKEERNLMPRDVGK